jgi:hypothetical protein
MVFLIIIFYCIVIYRVYSTIDALQKEITELKNLLIIKSTVEDTLTEENQLLTQKLNLLLEE